MLPQTGKILNLKSEILPEKSKKINFTWTMLVTTC